MFSEISFYFTKIVSRKSLVFWFLLGLTLVAYGNILLGDFVFDDNIFIENNLQIRSPSNIEQIYTSSTTAGSGLVGDNFYRPNQQLIFTILYTFFGLNPFFFHLVPIFFHALNGYLIFLLFLALGISARSSLLGAVIFLLHPILTQAVSYISGLSEPLATTSVLLTLLIFIRSMYVFDAKKFSRWLLVGLGVFAVGLLSKENASLALPFVILIFLLKLKLGEVPNRKRAIIFIVSLGVVSLFYVLARINFLNFTGAIGLVPDANPYTTNLWVRISTFFNVFPEYFKMLLWPVHLYYEKPYDPVAGISSLQSILGILLLLGGILASIVSFIKKGSRIFFGLAWFLLALIPVSGIIPLNALYLEHWLYMPVIGVLFSLCLLFDKMAVWDRKWFMYIFIIVMVLFSARIFARNLEWGDPVKFYQNELKYTQSSARIYANLGMELSDRADCDIAIVHYKEAIALNDTYPQTHHNLARCYEALGDLEKAASEYAVALFMQPNFRYSLVGLYNLFAYVKDSRSEDFLVLISRDQNGEMLTVDDIKEALR